MSPGFPFSAMCSAQSFALLFVSRATMHRDNQILPNRNYEEREHTSRRSACRWCEPDSLVAIGFSPGLLLQGIDLLENPTGVITHFGFFSDVQRTRTEPNENTYLVLD